VPVDLVWQPHRRPALCSKSARRPRRSVALTEPAASQSPLLKLGRFGHDKNPQPCPQPPHWQPRRVADGCDHCPSGPVNPLGGRITIIFTPSPILIGLITHPFPVFRPNHQLLWRHSISQESRLNTLSVSLGSKLASPDAVAGPGYDGSNNALFRQVCPASSQSTITWARVTKEGNVKW
jgi:hypothetical protein